MSQIITVRVWARSNVSECVDVERSIIELSTVNDADIYLLQVDLMADYVTLST